MSRPVAFVTGASRGIGKASAVALARAGYDVAISARTVHEGDGRADTLDGRTGTALPGSLDATAALVVDAGARALPVPMDLMDRATVVAAFDTVMSELGRIDVLLNNAIYQGPGTMTTFLETPAEELEKLFEGNVLAQLELVRLVLPHMLERGSGILMNMSSATAYFDPPAPAGKGGWGMGYAASKAALNRVVPILAVEHADSGVLMFTLEPGYVVTERAAMNHKGTFDDFGGAAPELVAAAVAWLATEPAASEHHGQLVHLQKIAKVHALAG
jgi:NAD(P)-dependent dehydrogenase (short-subunit alcohol dehydrogenase family)